MSRGVEKSFRALNIRARVKLFTEGLSHLHHQAGLDGMTSSFSIKQEADDDYDDLKKMFYKRALAKLSKESNPFVITADYNNTLRLNE